jgi:superfamily I DNA/RNA helicase
LLLAATGSELGDLNPQQREAVRQTEGPVLILAGAGSGKTRVITRRIAYILSRKLAQPSQILAVTFTNKAAEEMRERVAKLVGTKAAKDIVVSTFHSFCLRMLREHIEHLGYRKNFTICGEGDTRTLLKRVIDERFGPQEGFSPAIFLEEIGWLKSANGDAATAPPRIVSQRDATREKYVKELPAVFELYTSALRAANTVDFDDLLLLTLRLWTEHPRILARCQDQFHYVMVDEYQDTNRTQYELLRKLAAKRRNLCVVGDDDQSIYGWRGADVRNILDFERDYPDATVVTLDQNYRSTQTILRAANAVIAQNEHRRDKTLWSHIAGGRPMDWLVVGDEEHEAKMAAKWLKTIQNSSGANYSDFAILYRSNLQSRPLEIVFRQAGIPYVVVGGTEFFERAEVKDIIAYLRVIANPHDEASFLRVVNMPRRGVGDTTLHAVHDLCLRESLSVLEGANEALKRGIITGAPAQGLRAFLHLVVGFRKRFREANAGLRDVLAELIAAIGYQEELRRSCKSEAQAFTRWQNVEAVLEAVQTYEKEAAKPSLFDFLDSSALASDVDRMPKAERRRAGVTMMTIHSAKGLEYPFVFIMGLEEGLLPHERSLLENNLDEERRLFYVALTRAQRHVTLFEAVSRKRFGRDQMRTTSRFLSEIPEELYTQKILAVRAMVEERVAPPKPKAKARRRKRPGIA